MRDLVFVCTFRFPQKGGEVKRSSEFFQGQDVIDEQISKDEADIDNQVKCTNEKKRICSNLLRQIISKCREAEEVGLP